MANPIYLHIYWHQHQPWYFKPDSYFAPMPWVRLHGVKDYYDIAWLSQHYEGWKQTINLVPSLLRQIRFYLEENATDHHLELSRKSPETLNQEEKRTALDFLFHGHSPQLIQPYPRYNELFHKRGGNLDEAVKRFTDQDFLDLQVWHNLTWIDPIWRKNPSLPLYAIELKQRNFNENDKELVLNFQREILQKIIPLHQELYQQGKIELTTTPYYHPILPLLCDNTIATISNPHDPVPQPPFSYPQDAEKQIIRGLEYFEECFGFQPKGLWPSEGSVSDAALALIAKQGIQYVATDENILFRSSTLTGFPITSRQELYGLHQLNTSQGPLDILFRDHELSDLIGFVYQRMQPKEAARDFVKRLHTIGKQWYGNLPPFVNVILDGENCWEFYPNDGHDFLRYWIEAILEDEQIQLTTPTEYRQEFPAQPTLSSIFPGSWINNNFRIWIGHPEDNAAWHQLRLAREELTQVENSLDENTRQKAWEQLYICEGSDWFWWYGDDNYTELDWLFDQLFRDHLSHLYALIGRPVPSALTRSIRIPQSTKAAKGGILFHQPLVSGRTDGYYEWVGTRRITASGEGGAMYFATPNMSELRVGRYGDWLCFWIQLEEETGHDLQRLAIQITKPIDRTVELIPAKNKNEISHNKNIVEGMLSLIEAGISKNQEIWFCFLVEAQKNSIFTLPTGSEIYLQGYTEANASVYWFV